MAKQNLDQEQLGSYLKNKNDYANAFQHGHELLKSGKFSEYKNAVQGVRRSLPQVPLGDNLQDESNRIDAMGDDVPFFVLLYAVLLFGYKSVDNHGRLLAIKQKGGQDAANAATDYQRMLLDIKNLINDDKLLGNLTDKTLFGLFAKAFSKDQGNIDPGIKNILERYKGLLGRVEDPATGKPYLEGINWDNPTDTDRDKCGAMLNGLIDQINTKLFKNGVSDGGMIAQFTITDHQISFDGENKQSLNLLLDGQQKSCEDSSTQLTTINQTLEASVNQSTESIKSLIEWLKQTIQAYGQSINPR